MNNDKQYKAQHHKDIVLLIHGTSAGDPSDEGTSWWQRGSAFWSGFSKKVGADFECQPPGQVFHWSGANSERSRQIAAEDLATWIIKFEDEMRPYHLIGHSHGGSVIWMALRIVSKTRGKLPHLRSWATVGTPFLHYRAMPISFWWSLPAVGALGCAAYLLPQIRSYFTVLEIALEAPSGWSSSLLILPLIWAVLLVMMGGALIRLGTMFYASAQIKAEQKAGTQAYRSLWDRYLGLWCDVDEAIGGLASTLSLRNPVVPRIHQWQSSTITRILSILAAPIRGLYNILIAQASDEFIWDRVTRRLQGNDRSGCALVKVARGPVLSFTHWPELPEDISLRLVKSANDNAALTLASVRNVLGLAAESTSNQPGIVTGIMGNIKSRELVHNSYFAEEGICELLSMHVTGERTVSNSEAEDNPQTLKGWLHAGRVAIDPDGAKAKGLSAGISATHIRPAALPAILSLAVTAVLAIACLVSSSIYTSSVYPYTDQHTLEYIVSQNILPRVISSDSNNYVLSLWVSSLTQAGFADRALSAAARIEGHEEDRLRIMAGVAHELIVGGQSVRAESILNDALTLVRSHSPDTADGFLAVARELAHMGRAKDAMSVVDLFPQGLEDWKENGLAEIAEGYADAKLLDETFGALDRIINVERRAKALQSLIRTRPASDPVMRRAIDALLALAPGISDERNWHSGSLSASARGLAKLGDTDKAIKVARSIPNPQGSSRASALIAIAGSLISYGQVDKARQVVEEAIAAQPQRVDAAIILAQIARIAHDPGARSQAIRIVENASASTGQEQLPSQLTTLWVANLKAVAEGWAELGEPRRCLEAISRIPLGFEKDTVSETFTGSIQRLVALEKTPEVAALAHEMHDPALKSLALIALARASRNANSRILLGEAEKLAETIQSEDLESFVLSEIAKGWAEFRQYRHAIMLSERTRASDRLQVYQMILDHYLVRHGQNGVLARNLSQYN